MRTVRPPWGIEYGRIPSHVDSESDLKSKLAKEPGHD